VTRPILKARKFIPIIQEMNYDIPIPGLRLGILGGGQLGRMIAIEARRMGVRTLCLDPSPRPPAFGVADECIVGDLYDPAAIENLAQKSDVLTFEIEHVNSQFLKVLEDRGFPIYPSPRTLEIIQDKYTQKSTLAEANLPVPRFSPSVEAFDGVFPLVQKARIGGYDGRGVKIVRSVEDLRDGPEVSTFFEEYIPFQKEIAVLLARGRDGEVRSWPVIEMVFDPETQICNQVCAPARISESLSVEAQKISIEGVRALNGVGVFAVELFVTEDSRVLINEIAPRPHNSGHWTIEGSLTSQFNQHLRAVCGFPLGSTEQTMPAVMINLLGSSGSRGTPIIRGYRQALSLPGLAMHWYEKSQVSTQRKMGHVTILRPTLEEALELAAKVGRTLWIDGINGG